MPLFKASFISKITLLLVSMILSVSAIAVDFGQTQQLASKDDAKVVHKLYYGEKTVKDIFPEFVTAVDLYQKAAEQGS